MSRFDSGKERWRIADQTAAFLFVDRDVCRRAFYREPVYRVAEAVEWVLSQRNGSEHEIEAAIEGWARKHAAGIYTEDRPFGGLLHVGEVVLDAVPWVEEAERPDLNHTDEYFLYLELVRAKERNAKRQLLPSELESFTRAFYASRYRKDSRQFASEQRYLLSAELEDEER